jgi:CubicO group peptidase (beta-lactamase class C family)/beta-glucosidase-like glycosyl hydrolase
MTLVEELQGEQANLKITHHLPIFAPVKMPYSFAITKPDSRMLKKIYIILSLLTIAMPLSAQNPKNRWVDSVLRTMTIPQKIGQLFMIPVSSYSTPGEIDALESKIKSQHPGGLLITKGSPKSLALLINRLQPVSRVPLMTGLNAEWGLAQTLDSTMSFQHPMVQSAWVNDSLSYRLGETVARQLKLVGIQINFAPRMDVYERQPDYLNYYSNRKQRLASKSTFFIRGLQDHGIIACARQVYDQEPTASRNDSSAVDTAIRLDTLELYTPLQMIRAGVGGLVTNHLTLSAFAGTAKKKTVPLSLSPVFIKEILKRDAGFTGLMFTDIPYLQTIGKKKKRGEIEELAFLIGNDVLIDPQNPAAAVKRIRKAIKKDPALLEQLDASVKKILSAKFEAGLAENHSVSTTNLFSRLHTRQDQLFHHQLAEASVTVVRNSLSLIPVTTLEDRRFISLSLGRDDRNEFNHYLAQYAPVRTLSVMGLPDTVGLALHLAEADVILIGLYPEANAFQKELIPLLKKMALQKEIVLCHFGNPKELNDWEEIPTVIAAYSGDGLAPKVAAQILFGGMGARGVLPIDVSDSIRAGQGATTGTHDRFTYTLPEAAGMDSKTLDLIRLIAQEGIDSKAFPGCRVLVAKDRKVVYDQSFGYLTYDKKLPVTDETIYDLASVTKVSATLQTVMFMVERGLIDINKKVSYYLPELRESNKKDFIVKDILTHQAGLWPFLPFWAQTMKDSVHMQEYYSKEASPDYPFPVSADLFASKAMKDSLWQWIIHAKIIEKPARTPYDYRYSDMGFYIMQHVAERILNQPMEEFLEQNLYEPLGAYTTGYLPLRKFSPSRIAPTEDDKLFRKSLLIGYVHDQGAAMHGGIAGHAGLFSTANDLAKLGQMWLQKGSYGGQRYFKPATLELFTEKQYENSRRGLGWDRTVLNDPNGPTSMYASSKTFGHTGFTGTCIWVDPAFNVVYVFLSNRVYPDMNNNKILNANIRPRIQDLIYKSIFTYCENQH